MSALVAAGALAKEWLASLGMLAAQGTVLAILALALTRLGRLRPAWQAALWFIVALKLALPWGPALPYSLSDLIATLTASHAAAPVPLVVGEVALRTLAAPSAWPAIGWLVLAFVWSAGAIVVLARAAVAQQRASRAARQAPAAPADARALLAELAARVRVRTPRLVVGGTEVGPHVVGLVRTIIVVPEALLAEPTLLRAALLHELAHVRRLDALGRLVQLAAGALMWWLPVMRLVHKRLEHAREAACDAWALESSELSRPAYARLLVRMAQLRTQPALALAAQHALDARVAAVLGPPARARLTVVQRIAIAAFACLALGGARSATAAKHGETCQYTPALAVQLLQAFPQADIDGDGTLSRDEACDLQSELRRIPEEERTSRLTPENDAEARTLLSESLCCRPSGELFASPEETSCQRVEPRGEGVEK